MVFLHRLSECRSITGMKNSIGIGPSANSEQKKQDWNNLLVLLITSLMSVKYINPKHL